LPELAPRRAALAQYGRHWLEIGVQTLFALGMLALAAGIFYPLYTLYPFVLNPYWIRRHDFLLELLPLGLGFLSFYLLGCWVWLRLHGIHPLPFKRFWLGQQLLMSLGSTLLLACLLQISWRLTAGPVLMALSYGLGLCLCLVLLLPWLAGLRPSLKALLPALALALLQSLGLWLLPWPLLACLLMLGSLLLIPVLALSWEKRSESQAGSPWQLLLGCVLIGFGVTAVSAWWSVNQLAPEYLALPLQIQAQRRQVKFEALPLRGPARSGNAWPAYSRLFGHDPISSKRAFRFSVEDGDRIRRMFDLASGRLQPDAEMLARYQPQLQLLEQALHHQWIQYPQTGEPLESPEPGLMQDFSFLLMASALSRCQPDDCLGPAQLMLDTLRMLQQLAVQGQVMPMMVSYKLERIAISALGQSLAPKTLSLSEWKVLLAEWARLLATEEGRFHEVMGLELLLGQQTLLELIPTLSADAKMEYGSLLDWLGIAPYVRLGLPELKGLAVDARAYLAEPVHAAARWRNLDRRQQRLAEQNPFASQVLIDLPMVLQRYREHQVMFRGFYQYLALQAYAAESGAYPAELTALVPRWLPALPQDPYTGQPFNYHLVPEGFYLASTGSNGRADGGGQYYAQFMRGENCQGDEIVFAPVLPEACRPEGP
jgi:hypothetical protein